MTIAVPPVLPSAAGAGVSAAVLLAPERTLSAAGVQARRVIWVSPNLTANEAINATCPSCGMVFIGVPPEQRLCGDCLRQLELVGYEPAPGAPYDDLPPCPDCGGQMVEVVPIVQPPASESGNEQNDGTQPCARAIRCTIDDG